MFVAIQQQNLRAPIVFGLGATADAALTDARRSVETLDEIVVVPCSDALVEAVANGVVDCEVVNGVATIRQ
jgi:hypothetical protein